MSRINIKTYSTERRIFVSLVDAFDCPVDPYVSVYMNEISSGNETNTVKRYANELRFVLEYFFEMDIDLVGRMMSAELISLKEFTDFHIYALFRRGEYDPAKVSIIPDRENKGLQNAIAVNSITMAKVAPDTTQGRVRALRLFIEWLFEQFHGDKIVSKGLERKHDLLIARIKAKEKELGKEAAPGDAEVSNIGESVIPDDVFLRLLKIIRPDSEENPFSGSKVRNYLIVMIFIVTGIRRGALAKLKISDCIFHGNYDGIRIKRSGFDQSDTRIDRPKQKTNSHLSSVPPKVMAELKIYIDVIRTQYPQSDNHDYVFISEKDSSKTAGNPFSLRSINSILQKLSKTLNFRLHPHKLRHKWNDVFDEKGQENGVDRRLIEDCRKYAMGWSETTTMNQIYNDRMLQRTTAELMRKHQEEMEHGR